jgi:hypothetical protein
MDASVKISSNRTVGFRFAKLLQFVLSGSCRQSESFREPSGLSPQGARQIAKETYILTWVRSCALGALALAILVGYTHAQGTTSVGLERDQISSSCRWTTLGVEEPGVYGGGILRGAPTPRIDPLAAEAMRLLTFNVEAQCTPSRAALMTRRYAIRTGNGSVPIDTPVYGLVQWEITMAEMLSDAGYRSLRQVAPGHTEGRFPTDKGFDEWYGIPNSTHEALWPDNPRFRPNSNPNARPEYIMEGHKGAA